MIVQESEPELEALSDTAEPEAVTEDAAEFGNPSPEEFPAGPGDAPVDGEDETLDSGGPPVGQFEDDPLRRHADRRRAGGGARGGRGRTRLVPIRTCAGCGRKAPQAELQRFHAKGDELVAGIGPGRGVYTCRRLACFERANAHRAFNRTPAENRPCRACARAALHLRTDARR